ncbi:MAG: H-type lectin domain-containing protein, partial [Verrucomicrobiota bacterium]
LKWMGIAYSGNTMRAGFWSDVSGVQTHRLEMLQKYKELNMRVCANHLALLPAQNRLVNGELAQQDKDRVDDFFAAYGNLFQIYEVANEPGLIGPISKAAVIAHTNYARTAKPGHVDLAAPGWAYNTWATNTANRKQIEDLCDLIGGHAYGPSFRDDPDGSFVENLRSQGPILTNGFPKDFIATEMGSNNFHSDYIGSPSQTHASIFDRIVRAHIAVSKHFLQHATHYKVDNAFEDFSLFAPINWNNSPNTQARAPGVGGEEPRLKTFRRLALAYATHGKPLPYTYRNNVTHQRVYFRAVDTGALPPLAGSGATSDKVLLNFVNFENVTRQINITVTMPQSGTWTGDRIGAGNTYSAARQSVNLSANPTLDINVSLPPRESVQYILTPPAGGGGGPGVGNLQMGKATFSQPGRGQANYWRTVTFPQAYSVAPVVVASPVGWNDGAGCAVRIRAVNKTSFQWQIDEWDYLNGAHPSETISWAAIEGGDYTLSGRKLTARKYGNINQNWQTKNFTTSFSSAPVVVASVTTDNNTAMVVPRMRNISGSSFQVRIQEQQSGSDFDGDTSGSGNHPNETISYLAIEPGAANDSSFKSGLLGGVDEVWEPLVFGGSYPGRFLFGSIQTFAGGDPVVPRHQLLNNTSVYFRVQEEASQDAETGHVDETIGWLIFD